MGGLLALIALAIVLTITGIILALCYFAVWFVFGAIISKMRKIKKNRN